MQVADERVLKISTAPIAALSPSLMTIGNVRDVCNNERSLRRDAISGACAKIRQAVLEAIMRDIIDGFLRCQSEVYPRRVELFSMSSTLLARSSTALCAKT